MNEEQLAWFENWKVTHNTEGDNVWTLELPNQKPWAIKIRVTKENRDYDTLVELISYLEKALTEITTLDNRVKQLENP